MQNDMKEPTREDFLEKTLVSHKKAICRRAPAQNLHRYSTFLKFCFRIPHVFKGANMEEVPVKAKSGCKK